MLSYIYHTYNKNADISVLCIHQKGHQAFPASVAMNIGKKNSCDTKKILVLHMKG